MVGRDAPPVQGVFSPLTCCVLNIAVCLIFGQGCGVAQGRVAMPATAGRFHSHDITGAQSMTDCFGC
ncbi:MAG: hypothetical protein ACJASV_001717 [Pseudorhodobacter sp.]|jgi:hypothetical protein